MTQRDFNAALRSALEGDLLIVANLDGAVGVSPKPTARAAHQL